LTFVPTAPAAPTVLEDQPLEEPRMPASGWRERLRRAASPAEDTVKAPPDANDAAFRAVYDAHFETVWRCLRRLGVREPDVLDQTQKVFLVVHAKLGTFEGRSLLRIWLFGICRRVASDYRRSALIRYEVTTDPADLESIAAWRRDPTGASRPERERVAESILNKLPEAQRTVFVLFELEEVPGEEIAALLDIPVGTVRSRLRLARESFRREVKRLAAKEDRGEIPRTSEKPR
jgi:RNA polymerase sigma-70 factor (ECF subfamily)